MTTELVLRYFHFAAILVMFGSLAIELALLKSRLPVAVIGRLAIVDGIYGAASVILLTAGLTLWLGGYGKATVFYTQNPVFITKLVLVGTIGILSIYPTVFFLKNRKATTDEVEIPAVVINFVKAELIMMLVIPFLAGLMSRGVGY